MTVFNFENVLVLAPHTDDGELGVGGFIAKLIELGSNVYYAAFSTAEESVPEGFPKNVLEVEMRNATAALGIPGENVFVYKYAVRKLNYHRQEILENLISLRKMHSFDLVLMPSLSDIHQDHKTIAEEGVRAFKGTTIFGYELIWNNLSFNSTAFVDLDERHVLKKYNALRCYQSQSHRPYMSEEFIKSLAKVRGIQIGSDYAECFEVIRMKFE